jgi:asparagine synthase (glutamine-hydrolysing)
VSELVIAQRAAELLGTDHVGLELETGDYFARFADSIEQVEEPLAHPGMLLQSDLSRLARRSVKVVLTGQGADEPLGGYPRHQAARLLPLLSRVAAPVSAVARVVGGAEYGARVGRVLRARPGLERVAALYSPLTPEQAGGAVRGCGPDRGREIVLGALRPWWERCEGLDEVGRVLYVDVRTSLAEDLLVVADKMSMAHGLELRVPFLDLEYLGVLESLPGARRVSLLGRRKRIQHQLAERLLPSPLARALRSSSSPLRRKRAFDVPVAEWFRGPWREKLPAYLRGSASVLPSFVDGSHVQMVMDAFLGGGGRRYRALLSLFVLETWLRAALKAPATGAA